MTQNASPVRPKPITFIIGGLPCLSTSFEHDTP
ncbi:hypothetical protein PPSAL_3954 [Ectopseudomonas oleovorans]|uniref:Uncharacterized protein n=1 Tax=Ectopseudomonas oleovorans (strain CECT 5344) TaxID=1182590 RepID=W6R0C7_ECTO5|nr:hypothetical protein BN5_4013 [Pseudomonas oleovorans CECT 5344]CDR93178.1 hypothetical protein PPSAL_3954 [Pseudomonas oleovorans]